MSAPIDLVCWDFGDTLVDERFMRIAPAGVDEWSEVYDEVLTDLGDFDTQWMLGQASMNDLVAPLAQRLPMTRAAVARHMRAVWRQITWFPEARAWIEHLQGRVIQAIVTVNPHEFHGIATACGLDPLVDLIVTSADLATLSKVTMTEHAREILGLAPGLSTSVLIDNRRDNVAEFAAAGGHAIHFERATFAPIAETMLTDNRLQFIDGARNTPDSD